MPKKGEEKEMCSEMTDGIGVCVTGLTNEAKQEEWQVRNRSGR